jgi:hypothetical protein
MREFRTGEDGFVAPDVIGGQYAGWEEDATPELAYVPATVVAEEVAFELRRTAEGGLALPAYSTLDDLVRCCGPHQRWVSVRTEGVAECARACGADVVLWDVALPEGAIR